MPRRAPEGLCVGGLPADAGQVHQHVRRAGRAQEHEVQRQERPLRLQTVRPLGQTEHESSLYLNGIELISQFLFLVSPLKPLLTE